MYRSLLVPLDGSPTGEQVLPFARQIARSTGAALELLHVHAPQHIIFIEGMPVIDEDLHSLAHAHDRVYLERIAKPLATDDQLSVGVHVIDGAIVPAILQQAKILQSDLIVMTTHGRGGLARAWLGSVADGLIRHSEQPVLLIHPDDAAPDATGDVPFPHVLVPLEPTSPMAAIPVALKALDPAERVRYTVLRVVDQRTRDVVAEASQFVPSDSRITSKTIEDENPARAILDFAAEQQVSMIAVQPHNDSGLRRMLLGSVADKLIRGANVPILVYRATIAEE